MTKLLCATMLFLCAASALTGCRGGVEVDPDGNVTSNVPAAR
jgi:hypothetical protein